MILLFRAAPRIIFTQETVSICKYAHAWQERFPCLWMSIGVSVCVCVLCVYVCVCVCVCICTCICMCIRRNSRRQYATWPPIVRASASFARASCLCIEGVIQQPQQIMPQARDSTASTARSQFPKFPLCKEQQYCAKYEKRK